MDMIEVLKNLQECVHMTVKFYTDAAQGFITALVQGFTIGQKKQTWDKNGIMIVIQVRIENRYIFV